jgi:hypothetical protein
MSPAKVGLNPFPFEVSYLDFNYILSHSLIILRRAKPELNEHFSFA